MSKSNWTPVTLGDVITEMKSGLSRLLSSEDIGLPVLRSNNIQDGKIDVSDVKYWYVDDPQGATTTNYLIKKDDLLVNFINSKAQIGKTALYNNELNRDCIYTTNIMLVRCSDKINPYYLKQITETEKYSKFIEQITKPAVNQASFTTNDFKSFEFLLPPRPIQDRIAEILSAWDAAIAKTQALIEKKEHKYKILSINLLFGKRRLAGFPKTEHWQKTHWFSIPSDWDLVPISKVAEEVSERNSSTRDIPVLSCTKHHGLVNSLEYFGKQIFSEDTSTYKVVKRNEFAYATNHIEEGSIGYQNLHEAGLVSPMYTVFRTDQSTVCDGYLFKVLKTEIFRHIFEANTSASVDRRGSLRWSQFSELKLPSPSKDEQNAINEVLDIAKSEINRLQDYKSLLIDQKKGLMQKLLTGEWSVYDASVQEVAVV